MPDLKKHLLRIESESLKRSIGFMLDENIHLKNSIAVILKKGFNRMLLDKVEFYHTRFLKEDELLRLLRNEVAELEKFIYIIDDKVIFKDIKIKLKEVSDNIIKAEKQFASLKFEFNCFLSENFLFNGKCLS